MFPGAKCKDLGPDFFFPQGGVGKAARNGNSTKDMEEHNAKLCRGELPEFGTLPCPAIKECLKYALDNNEDGVYGGTTSIERKGGSGKWPLPVTFSDVA